MYSGRYIINPLEEYSSCYLPRFLQAIEEIVERDARVSGLDLEMYRQQTDKLEKLEHDSIHAMIKLLLLLAVLILGGITAFRVRDILLQLIKGTKVWRYLRHPISVLYIVILIFLLWMLLPMMLNLYQTIINSTEQVNTLNEAITNEMIALIEKLSSESYLKIALDVIPAIQADQFLTKGRALCLEKNFDYKGLNCEENEALNELLTGYLGAVPFVLAKYISCQIQESTYFGSEIIFWNESEEFLDKDRKKCTRNVTRSEKLTASVTKPLPVYKSRFCLSVISDRAESVEFIRKPSLRKRIIKKNFKHGISSKDICRELNIENLSGDEIEFCVMFNESTVSSLKNLMDDHKYGFGDDFSFEKGGAVLTITSDHMQSFSLRNKKEEIIKRYNYDLIKQGFMEQGEDYFRKFYFALAPALAITFYQRFGTTIKTEIECQDIQFGLSLAEMERIVNELLGNSSVICKVHPLSYRYSCIEVQAELHRYICNHEIEYVSVKGSDGKEHDIPVPYNEYVPSVDTLQVFIRTDMNGVTNLTLKEAKLAFLQGKWILDERSGILVFQTSRYSEEDDRQLNELVAAEKL